MPLLKSVHGVHDSLSRRCDSCTPCTLFQTSERAYQATRAAASSGWSSRYSSLVPIDARSGVKALSHTWLRRSENHCR